MNGKPFEYQLQNAERKLKRALETADFIDPITGFSDQDITTFIIDLPENNKQIAAAKAVLRRNGLGDLANTFST